MDKRQHFRIGQYLKKEKGVLHRSKLLKLSFLRTAVLFWTRWDNSTTFIHAYVLLSAVKTTNKTWKSQPFGCSSTTVLCNLYGQSIALLVLYLIGQLYFNHCKKKILSKPCFLNCLYYCWFISSSYANKGVLMLILKNMLSISFPYCANSCSCYNL